MVVSASRQRPGQAESGQAGIGLVLTMAVVIAAILAAVQFALWSHGASVVQAAAAQGDAAARDLGGTPAAGVAAARGFVTLAGGVLTHPHVTATTSATEVSVAVHAGVISLLPGIRLHVSAAVAGPAQVYRP